MLSNIEELLAETEKIQDTEGRIRFIMNYFAENEKQKKFNPEIIFDNRKIKKENKNDNASPIKEEKKSVLKKIVDKIKKIFKIKLLKN